MNYLNNISFLRIYLIFIIVSFIGYELNGQILKEFSEDHNEFIEQFESFMTKNITKENKAYIEIFVENWNTDSLFYVEKRDDIIKVCNLLLEKKSRAFPDFKNYLDVLNSFEQNPEKISYYNKWNEALLFLLENKKVSRTKINNFLTAFSLLLEKNLIYASSYVQWKATSEQFEIEIQEEQIKIVYENTSLVCYSKGDSMDIYDTKGWYDPLENMWYGQEGLVTWERAGYSREDVNAVLYEYNIELRKSNYNTENVKFTNVLYFDHPLIGRLEDAVRKIKDPESATYPRFASYTKMFSIKDIFENIDYVGGLSMHGSKLIGIGTENQKANLFLYNEDTLFMRASSVYFAFTKEKVTGRNTEVTLYLERDSIFHPDLLLTYINSNKELTFLKSDDYTSQGPYFNSYHNIDMNFEQLTWRYGDPYIIFTMARGSTIGNASFESKNFFNMDRYMQIQLIDPVHPLVQIRRYSRLIKSIDFYGEDYADYLKLPKHNVKQLLMRLSFLGFIFYNFETDEVTVKDKLNAYLEASVGKRDYDVINFESVTRAPRENAILDLKTFDLVINGMPEVFISDSQNVHIYPENNSIILKRNRSFQFNGKVEAGLFSFWGNNFFFNYDSFKINLQNIDSIEIRFITGEKNNYGLNIIDKVESMIEHVTGEIIIDEADNKSGRKSNPQYPIFKSREGSFVYYDDPEIQGGVYERKNFYFTLRPFEIDSLDNFNFRWLHFDGTFYSDDIFPVFDETLRLQEDNSLGFKHNTETDGIPTYQDKATFYDKILLSNAGLKGNGRLEYLTSVTKSDDFNFFPDSMNTKAQDFTIQQQLTGTQYPLVKSNGNYVHWEPYNDSWKTFQKEGPFIIYNDTTRLFGSIHLQPSGLSGEGTLDMTRAKMSSDSYNFLAQSFDAHNADFELRSLFKGIGVKTDSVDIHIDYQIRKGDVRSVGSYSNVEFPENKYVTKLNHFAWLMTKSELEFQKSGSIPGDPFNESGLSGATYISTHPQQDSLNFVSPLAKFDYSRNILYAQEVEYIRVADAQIYPDNGNVYIEPGGSMRTLINAKAVANIDTKYHQFHTAALTITSRKNYYGDARYDYIDENGQIQKIKFDKVCVNDSLYTYAEGRILEEADFKLSPFFAYQGKVNLLSTRKYLDFDGGVKIIHNCETVPSEWLSFHTVINPDSIYIPIGGTMKEINGRQIFAGTMIRNDSIHIYPSFLNVWQNYSDRSIVSSNGYLHYDHGGRYKISSAEKIRDFSLPGDYLSLQRDMCELYGEGKVDLNINLGLVKLESVGNVRHDVVENDLKLDIMLAIDFHIREDIILQVAKDLDSVTDNTPIDVTSIKIRKGYNEYMGIEETDKYYEELSMYGLIERFPKELVHTIFINELNLVWNRDSRSYQSVGKIGIGNILDNQINKYVDGFIEIERKRSGDKMDIFLKIDDKTWYYFGYTRGVMQVTSSNKLFVNLVRGLKKKERKPKIKRSKIPYNIIVSTDRKYLMFVRRWEEILEERNNP